MTKVKETQEQEAPVEKATPETPQQEDAPVEKATPETPQQEDAPVEKATPETPQQEDAPVIDPYERLREKAIARNKQREAEQLASFEAIKTDNKDSLSI